MNISMIEEVSTGWEKKTRTRGMRGNEEEQRGGGSGGENTRMGEHVVYIYINARYKI